MQGRLGNRLPPVTELTSGVINALARLMNDEIDMATLEDAAVLEHMRLGRSEPELLAAARKLVGKGAAELRRRNWTWPRIAAEFDVDQSTAHRWAQPYLKPNEQ